MKFLKLFESMTRKEVKEICKEYDIRNWTLKDGLVDVNGDVRLSYENLTRLPLQFGRVTGHFFCDNNQLTTLVGAPQAVVGDFYCNDNELTTLEGGPKEVGGDFLCNYNQLTTLVGAPQAVVGDFYCNDNELTTLEGGPIEVGNHFDCYNNNLTTLKWAPEYIGGVVDFLPNDNLPTEFLSFLKLNSPRINSINLQKYILKWQKDYAIWRRDGSFNKTNFIQMMETAQDELKKKIKFPK